MKKILALSLIATIFVGCVPQPVKVNEYQEAKLAYERGDYKKALNSFQRTCDFRLGKEMDYTDSCFKTGFMYYNGLGVRQNTEIAKDYFGLACDFGLQQACDNYRDLNLEGKLKK